MSIDNHELSVKFKTLFKLRYSPIAFYYTDNPPELAYNPKRKLIKHIPCIIQLLNGVKSGRTLVLGKTSKNLCPGGLAYLGFRRIINGLENFLSTGIQDPNNGKIILEGERFVKSPELAKQFLGQIPFKKSPTDFAIFTPLEKVNQKEYEPELVIFFVKIDQLAGLIQLANFDNLNRTMLGIGSGCSTIITEPLAEKEKSSQPRAVVGMLTDILARHK
ncbi:MAG: hypothetical protein EU535_06090 [Promethearchaeota archaeon]|nr:MAG: hypothetical protein EU535_06090 [Candidatus Lokiarchaeota archaeon]